MRGDLIIMEWVKANSESVKRQNRRMLLDVIRSHEGISRAEISKLTHLNKVTVSALVDELIQECLVQVIGNGDSTVGRKPVLLQIAREAGYFLGAELVPDYGRVLCMDLANGIVRVQKFPVSAKTRESLLIEFKERLRLFIHALPHSHYGVLGMGVAIRGVVDKDCSTVIQFADLQILSGYNLGKDLSEEFGVPVFVDNRANAAAWGEHRLGVAKDSRSTVYVILARYGIGSGYVLDDQLYRGPGGVAGEISHMPIDQSGPECDCGGRGCWTMYVSEQGVRNACHELGLEVDATMEDSDGSIVPYLSQRADNRDEMARKALARIGEYVGIGFATLVTVLDPDIIIIGGRMSMAIRWLLPSIEEILKQRCHPASLGRVKITVPADVDTAVVRGAAALVVDSSLDRLAAGSYPVMKYLEIQ